jgi:hypothetical protein
MPRGGRRIGAGGKFKWNHGKTKVVRIPESIADEVLEYAKAVDSLPIPSPAVTRPNKLCYDDVTQSKVIDLSNIVIRSYLNQPAVLLSDLIEAGYIIIPDRLMQSPSLKSALKHRKVASAITKEIKRSLSGDNTFHD